MMFRLMFFFMSFHRERHQAAIRDTSGARGKDETPSKFELGHVLETMDLMSFNLVLREVETAIAERNINRMRECVSVLKEMMHIVVSDTCQFISSMTDVDADPRIPCTKSSERSLGHWEEFPSTSVLQVVT